MNSKTQFFEAEVSCPNEVILLCCTSIWQLGIFLEYFSVSWELSSQILAGLDFGTKQVLSKVHACKIAFKHLFVLYFKRLSLKLGQLNLKASIQLLLRIDLCSVIISRSLVNFVGLEKTVTEMVTGCLRTMKSCHICTR